MQGTRTTAFLAERFAERGDRPAVIAPGATCSFDELTERIERWRRRLDREDVAPGSVVAVVGEFSPTTIALLLALADRGAIVLPQRGDEVAGHARQSEMAQVEAVYSVDADDEATLERSGRTAAHPLYARLRESRRPGLVLFTSGTSGEPKGVVHDLSLLLEKFHVRRPPLSAVALLLFDHQGGLNTMLHTLSNGATLVCPRDRSQEAVCEVVERHRVELLPATPTFLNLLLLSGTHRRYDLRSLRAITYGAEPMPAATLERLRAAFPDVRLQQTYGMNEIGVLRTKSRDDGSLWVKVGGEGVSTRVVDGRLQVRARSLLLGYLNAPTPVTDDGWLETGDMVEQDGEYLRILGRESDLINVGGEKVYPAEVEGIIESMDAVAEATVHGEPNGLLGNIVCAEVRPAMPPADPARLADEVKRHCRRRLERFKVPVRVRVTDEPQSGRRVKKARRRAPSPPRDADPRDRS